MASGKNVADLKRTLLKPALTSHFEIAMDSPFKAGGTQGGQSSLSKFGVRFEQDQLNLMCSEVSLPGSNLATLELTSDHTGVTERHAYRRIFDDRLDFTFYVDAANYMPIRFFEAWIDWIVGFDDGRETFEFAYWFGNYLVSLMIISIAFFFGEGIKRVVALKLGFRPEFKIWPNGLAIGTILVLISLGKFWYFLHTNRSPVGRNSGYNHC